MRHLVGILGYNDQARLDKCATSLLANLPEDTAVWLVDNGSTPLRTPDGLTAHYVAAQTGGGFTAALRWFLTQARILQCETATFCNDDLEFEPGCLARMIETALEPRVGVACPMQVAMHNPQVIICGGTGAAYPGGMHRTGQRGISWREARDARWMPFAAVTFNMAALLDIGMPDAEMTLWFSDSDYCIRARLAGYRVVYLGEQAVVRHEQSASVNRMEDEARRLRFVLDQTAFRRKWGGGILQEYST